MSKVSSSKVSKEPGMVIKVTKGLGYKIRRPKEAPFRLEQNRRTSLKQTSIRYVLIRVLSHYICPIMVENKGDFQPCLSFTCKPLLFSFVSEYLRSVSECIVGLPSKVFVSVKWREAYKKLYWQM